MHGECTHPLTIHGRRDTRRIGGLGVELAQNIVNLIKEGRNNEGVELVHWLAEAAHFAVEVVQRIAFRAAGAAGDGLLALYAGFMAAAVDDWDVLTAECGGAVVIPFDLDVVIALKVAIVVFRHAELLSVMFRPPRCGNT